MRSFMNRAKLPENIQSQMNAWREGFADFPKDYIDFHKTLAENALELLKQTGGLTVHRVYVDSDGWYDGMRVVYAIVEERSGRLVKLSWHDGNQEFFEHGAGSWPYRLGKV